MANELIELGRKGKRKLRCNKPVKLQKGEKKYIVRACKDGKEKVLRFGQKGYEDYLTHRDPKRRKAFKKRHRCAQKRNKLTAGWWACNYNW